MVSICVVKSLLVTGKDGACEAVGQLGTPNELAVQLLTSCWQCWWRSVVHKHHITGCDVSLGCYSPTYTRCLHQHTLETEVLLATDYLSWQSQLGGNLLQCLNSDIILVGFLTVRLLLPVDQVLDCEVIHSVSIWRLSVLIRARLSSRCLPIKGSFYKS